MGLFSFLKKAGASLAGKSSRPVTADSPEPVDAGLSDAEKVSMLKAIIESHGMSYETLDLSVTGDKVTVGGNVKSHEEREKIILALGNVSGIACVDDQMNVTAPPSQFYEVKRGDTLSKIAKEFYGNAMKYPVIFEANKPMLKDPDKIYPGQMLRIPPQ